MAVTAIPFSFPGLPGVSVVFTTALGGEAEGNLSYFVGGDPWSVLANRESLKKELGFNTWHSLRQVHGTGMVFEPDAVPLDTPSKQEGDGLATAVPGRALVVKTADCQPVLLAHESGRYVAALHVGWRGNVLEFPKTGVAEFCEHYGVAPGELMAVRGPSLGPGESEFTNFEMEFGDRFREFYDPAKRTVNLWRLTVSQLMGAGLRQERIFGLDLCTKCLPIFHSYRRDKARAGRQGSLIWMRQEA